MARYEDVKDMNFFDIINDIISDFFDGFKDSEGISGCELVDVITDNVNEGDNIISAFITGKENAWKFIGEHIDIASETFDFFGDTVNPFGNPEAYTLLMVNCGVDMLLCESDLITDNWTEKITLTPEVIAQIKKEICIPLEQIKEDFGIPLEPEKKFKSL